MVSEVLLKTVLAHIWTTELKWYHWLCYFWHANSVLWGASRITTEATPSLYDFQNCSKLLDFYLSADDANLFLSVIVFKDLNVLDSEIISELGKVIFGYM